MFVYWSTWYWILSRNPSNLFFAMRLTLIEILRGFLSIKFYFSWCIAILNFFCKINPIDKISEFSKTLFYLSCRSQPESDVINSKIESKQCNEKVLSFWLTVPIFVEEWGSRSRFVLNYELHKRLFYVLMRVLTHITLSCVFSDRRYDIQ